LTFGKHQCRKDATKERAGIVHWEVSKLFYLLRKEKKMTDSIRDLSAELYKQSSKLRAMARVREGNGDTERPSITFDAIELDGDASILRSVADEIDAVRDRLPDAAEA
jgi:hypothetical protein